VNVDGTVLGTYCHGLFHNDPLRRSFLASLRNYWGLSGQQTGTAATRHQQYDRLAALVRGSLDMPQVYRILQEGLA
jgi:adenosylcobyric acid synthase